MSSFDAELASNVGAIEGARGRLLDAVRGLDDDAMGRARRGGWPVREVLRHVIDSEVAYTKVIGFLRGAPVELANATDADVASAAAAAAALGRVRARLTAALDGVDEATFYELRALGRDQYSVVSVLENVAMHDDEHREQVARTLE